MGETLTYYTVPHPERQLCEAIARRLPIRRVIDQSAEAIVRRDTGQPQSESGVLTRLLVMGQARGFDQTKCIGTDLLGFHCCTLEIDILLALVPFWLDPPRHPLLDLTHRIYTLEMTSRNRQLSWEYAQWMSRPAQRQ